MSMTSKEFEADLDPQTGWPRVRFNFDNGWSASLVLRMAPNRTECMLASVAAAPTGKWAEGQTELGPTEAMADEAISLIFAIRQRADVRGKGQAA